MMQRLAAAWADRSLRVKSLVVISVPMIASAVIAFGFLGYQDAERTASDSVAHTFEVDGVTHELLSSLVDAESSIRGYLLTGRSSALVTYDAAVGTTPGVVDELLSLVANPISKARTASLRGAVRHQLEILSSLRAAGPAAGPGSPAVQALLTDGETSMAGIRADLTAIDVEEARLLAIRIADTQRIRTTGLALVGISLVLSLSLGVLAAVLLTTGIVRRVALLRTSAERLGAGEPPSPMPPARDELGQLANALERASLLLSERDARLRAAHAESTDLYEHAPNGYLSVGPAGAISRINATAATWLGYQAEELIGRPYLDLLTTESADETANAAPAIIAAGGSQLREADMLRNDGTTLAVLLASAITVDSDGRLAEARIVVQDNTRRRQAEEALATTRAELDRFFELAVDVFVVTDPNGMFVRVNRALADLLGVAQQTLLSRPWSEFVHPDDRARSAAEVARLVALGHRTISFENRYVDSGGGIHAMEWNAEFDPATGVVYGIARDVTDRRKADIALRTARTAAEDANRAKTAFLSRMSHELRTPLNSILGFSELLGLDELTVEQRDNVGYISRAGRHLLDLINEVLDISRIESGQMSISAEPVEIDGVVAEAVDLVRPLAAGRRITVDSTDANCAEHVLADRQRLKQVLLNLLANAVKYNREGGAITVSCTPADGHRLRITVCDTGYGIPPNRLDRLFTPFDRLGAEQGAVEGTGMGLALSKGFIEAMGGRIAVDSTPDVGSAFWIELDLVEGPLDSFERHDHAILATSPGSATSGRRVLYIEDNLASVRLVERILGRRSDVDLITTMQGRIGLDLAREHRPAVILLDLHLPDMGGREVLQQLQTDPRTRSIPVIVVSADATKSQITRLVDDGAFGYLTKPFDAGGFIELVDAAVARGDQ